MKLWIHILLLAAAQVALAQDEAAPAEEAPVEEAPVEAVVEEIPAEVVTEAVPVEPQCLGCPKVTVQHYQVKQCTEVYNRTANPCCPVSFDCPEDAVYANTATTCAYKGVTYQIGDAVPIVGPCRKSCTCNAPIHESRTADIICAQIECPPTHTDLLPGCKLQHQENECCAVKMTCAEPLTAVELEAAGNVTYATPDCVGDNGFGYFAGDIMSFPSAPCQHCVCSKEYSGPYGPGCSQIDCGLDYKFSQKLKEGCVPLYTNAGCCPNPADWVCPDGRFIINTPNPATANITDTESLCKLGQVTASPGTSVPTYSCSVNCVCNTPPDFTCVVYQTCELALQALRLGILP